MRGWGNIKDWYGKPKFRFYNIKWIAYKDVQRERIRSALETKRGEILLDKDFYKDLAARTFELERGFWKVTAIQSAVWLFAVLGLLEIYPSINVAGLAIKADGPIREIALVISALLGFFAGLQTLQINLASLLLDIISEKKSGEDLSQLYRLRHAKLIGNIDFERAKYPIKHTLMSRLYFATYGIIIILFLLSLYVLGVSINIWMIYDVWMHPSFNGLISYIPITMLILANVSYLFAAYSKFIKLPYRDYTQLHEIYDLRTRDKEEFMRRVEKSYRPSLRERLTGRANK